MSKNLQTKEEQWEEEFDKEFNFPSGDVYFSDARGYIKNFIRKIHQEAIESTKEGDKEFVICSAIRMPDGYIIRGHRHNDCLLTASKIPRYKLASHAWGENQGFMTSKGRYVTREQGAKLQIEAGIKSKMPEGQEYLHGELYSEDLY